MDLGLVALLAQRLQEYNEIEQLSELGFIWHGGEPLALPIAFYEQCRDIFADTLREITHYHTIQTNLTVLPTRHKDFLASGSFFSGIGYSIDPFGNQRRTIDGSDSTHKVIENIDWLLKQEIPCSAITVLSQQTKPFVLPTYHFFEQIGTPVRFLPFYKSADSSQLNTNALGGDEILSCWIQLFDYWLRSNEPSPIDPLTMMMDYALDYIRGATSVRYGNQFGGENIIVDHLGDVWSADDDYTENCKFGNIRHKKIEEVLCSKNRFVRLRRASQNMEKYCASCKYYGPCPGQPIRFTSAQQEEILTTFGCVTKKFLDAAVPRIGEIIERVKSENSALSNNLSSE